MPTKTIYVPDDALHVFEKAKELAGGSISGIVIQALNNFIQEKESEEKSIEPIERWVGYEDCEADIVRGNWIKFYGRKLSDAVQDRFETDRYLRYELFFTKKGLFLLYWTEEIRSEHKYISGYESYKSLKEVMNSKQVPPKLIFDAEKQMPGVACEELDV